MDIFNPTDTVSAVFALILLGVAYALYVKAIITNLINHPTF